LSKKGITVVEKVSVKTENLIFSDLPTSRIKLEKYRIRDYDVGKVLCAAVSGKLKLHDFNVESNIDLIKKYLIEANSLIFELEKIITEYNPDIIISTNDRILTSGIVGLVSRKSNVNFSVFYWGKNKNHVLFYDNSLYDKEFWQHQIRNISVKKYFNFDSILFQIFYKRTQIFGLKESKKYKKIKKLEINQFDKNKKIISFFPGTNWENSGLIKPPLNIFTSQEISVEFLLKNFSEKEWSVVVRHHPYANNSKSPFENHLWEKCRKYSHFYEIMPEEDVDSYSLIKKSEICAIYNSTIGLECIIMKKPLIIFGDPYWKNTSWSNLIEFDDNKDKIIIKSQFIVPISEIKKIWLFNKNLGSKFKYIKNNGIFLRYKNIYIFENELKLYLKSLIYKLF